MDRWEANKFLSSVLAGAYEVRLHSELEQLSSDQMQELERLLLHESDAVPLRTTEIKLGGTYDKPEAMPHRTSPSRRVR